MNINKFNIITISVLSLLISVISLSVHHLNKKELIECTCFKKYDAVSRGGVRYFYMVLNSSKGPFTLNVTPETYFNHEEGNKVSFELRPTEYKSGPLIVFIQLSFVLECILIGILVIFILYTFSTKEDD